MILKEKWDSLPSDASFFSRLRYISIFYKKLSKHIAKEHKMAELNTRENPEIATTNLHDDIYNVKKQGEVNQHKRALEGRKTRKARGAIIRARVGWQKASSLVETLSSTGTREFSVRQRNGKATFQETTCPTSLRYGTRFSLARKLPLGGPFGIRQW